ncbi:MAG: FAD-dependent oxidoreductase, partial [Thermodesulfobacteriota bacterium]
LGCPRPVRLNLPGEDLAGIFHGLSFLKAVRSGRAPDMHGRVLVIGGGNVAVDSAQTSLRLGAESAALVSLEAEGNLPAFPSALEDARREGVTMECSWGPTDFVPGLGSKIQVRLRRCLHVFDEDGLFRPEFDETRTKTLEADQVIVAVGQRDERGLLPDAWKDREGDLVFDPLTLQAAPKLFHAGDLVGGPSSVVEAMASGRRAAESVNRYLAGRHLRYNRAYPGPHEFDFEIGVSSAKPGPRNPVPLRPPAGKGDFGEIERAFDPDTARREADRCLSCGGPFGKYRTCWFCLPCEVECPHQALRVEIPYLLR